jgi:membrane-bound ClpP family serine protease
MGAVLHNLPAFILMLLGFVLVLLEMYVPGFGVLGILGSLSLVAGVALFARSPVEGVVLAIVIVVLLSIALLLSIRSATKGRLAQSRLILRDVSVTAPQEKEPPLFVGKAGTARTALRPSGIAEFDGVRLNVVSDGQWIEAGQALRVDSVEGNRIVVSAADAPQH